MVELNRRRAFAPLAVSMMLALGMSGIASSAALADKPEKSDVPATANYVLTGTCSFDVNIDSTADITAIHYFDKSGNLIRIFNHVDEQDTFSANGNTLAGVPFKFNIEAFFDVAGNLTSLTATGVVEKIRLPDGSLFISAGQVDYLAHDATFILTPDEGHSGNLAAFCAALS